MTGAALGAVLFAGAVAVPNRALAANECGTISTGTPDTVACFGNQSYPAGISYSDSSGNDLTVLVFGQTGIIPPVSVNSSGNGLTVGNTAGAVTINTYNGTSITAVGDGIYGYSTGGSGAVSINNASTINATSIGIAAHGSGTGAVNVLNTGNVTMTGSALDAIQARSGGSGDIYVHNEGALSGASYGVFVGTHGGNVTVNNYATIQAGNGGAAAWGIAVGGNTGTYYAHNVDIFNTAGITATASGNGSHATGIQAYGNGNVDVSNGGSIVATGTFATGVDLLAAGNVDFNQWAGDITANGKGYGVNVFSEAYDGHARVTVMGNVTSTGGSGIYAGGNGTVSVQFGNATITDKTISAGYSGVIARGLGGGNGSVNVKTYGLIDAHGVCCSSKYMSGIYASTSETGGINITENGGITGHSWYGIYSKNTASSGDTKVHINGSVGSYGTPNGGIGVLVKHTNYATTGNITIDGAGNVYGNQTGIAAKMYGNGSINVNVTGNVTGFNNIGIWAYTKGYGDVNVTSGGYATGYNAAVKGGITNIFSAGNVTVTNNGSAIATGAYGVGVWGYNRGGGSTLVTNHGYASGYNGVQAGSQLGTSTATNDGTVRAYNYGVWAYSHGGDVTVNNNVGGDIRATGDYGIGIFAQATAYTGPGIRPAIITTNVTVNNHAYVYGYQDGIRAYNDLFGNVTVNNTGTAIGHWGYGVNAYNAHGGAIMVDNTGSIGGGYAGVSAYTTGNVTIHNHGGGEIWGYNGLAIRTTYYNSLNAKVWSSGSTTVNNDAGSTIWGAVALSANSTINNAGTWEMYGNSYFRTPGNATVNIINNSGSMHVYDTDGPQNVTVYGVTTLNNTGIVDLRNGFAGDVLSFPGATFAAGTGSRLGIDANLTSPLVADELVVGTATGTTVITLADTAPNAPASLNFVGVPVVVATNGAAAGSFTMPTYHKGFVDYVLVDPASTWTLFGVPSSNSFEMLKAAAEGQDFWRRSADAWSAREQEVRDSLWGSAPPTRAPGWEMWAQAHLGDQRDTRPSQTFTVSSLTFTPNLGTNTDYRGFQMGGDQLTTTNWLWGFTAGFVEQNTRFRALQQVTGQGAPVVHDDIDISGWNIGVYGGWTSGMFFMNGLLKGDWFSVDANFPSAGARKDFDGNTWGAKGEIGFRFGSPGFYLEPLADIDWTTTHLNNATLAGATFSWNDSESSRGELGARVGGQWGSMMPYLGLYAVDQWSGNNKMTMITGVCPGACMSVEDTTPGTYGKADFGFTITNWSGLEGFLKGEALFGNHTEGFSGRMGVRWRW